MARPKKRKAAKISASETAADKKQEASQVAKKKQKIDDTQNASAQRLTRSASNNLNVKDATAKSSSIGKAGRWKKNSPTVPAKVTKSATQKPTKPGGEEERQQPNLSIDLTPKRSKGKKKAKKEEKLEDSESDANDDGHQYWLMKAEPESRIEKGKDVKFSIDDLKASSSPEPWDGVRNLEARNNMRAMNKGDLAFFYHSNCKVPGIVGIMEIVQEHSVDESAFDQQHPYYDEKSSRENPKWHLVHVGFKQKFPEMIKLKELQKFSKEGGTLENMQAMRRSRLSVSKVSRKEWDFIMSLVDTDDEVNDNIPPAESSDDPKTNPKTNGVPQIHPETNGEEKDSAEATKDLLNVGEGDDAVGKNAAATSATEPLESAMNA